MTWFKSNYHKALLGGGAVISVGLLYFGWSQQQLSGKAFNERLMGGGKVSTGVDGAEQIAFAKQSMELDHGWKQGVTPEGREVDLFTGIPLFIKRDTGGLAIDLLKDQPVHPPIPNEFWLKYRLDPGFADSPLQDPDGDGFTHLEEWRDETDPTDEKDHPPLIKKLRFVEAKSVSWLLLPGFLNDKGAIPMKYEDTNGFKNNQGAADPIKPGQMFFTAGAAQGRFKYLDSKQLKRVNPSTNIEETITIVRIEDQKANKAGQIYEFPAPLPRDRKQHIQRDSSAVMKLEALNEGGNELVIEENTRFSLPAGQDKKPYLLKSVSADKIVVEYPTEDGKRDTVEIPKGGLPRLK